MEFARMLLSWPGAAPALMAALAALSSLPEVKPEDLRVTSGVITSLDGWMRIEHPKVRAFSERPTELAELHVRYLGGTAKVERLGSGAVRRQVVLQLRAPDPCNVLSISWRIEPSPQIAVTWKNNPGMARSSECGNGGYVKLRPDRVKKPPPLAANVEQVMRAAVLGDRLVVTIGGAVVWEGDLPPGPRELQGPVGLRTDNGRFQLKLFAEPAPVALPAVDAARQDLKP